MPYRIPLPDQSYLIRIFDYDNETGDLYWRYRNDRLPVWNKSWAGKVAGTRSKSGYIDVGIDGKLYRSHRIVWKLFNGYDPDSIDHINGDVSDNRIENLRDVSHQENHKNRFKYRTNTSGVTGVFFNKRLQKWTARIGVDGTYVHLGVFSCFDDAVRARLIAEKEYRFHDNHGREYIV